MNGQQKLIRKNLEDTFHWTDFSLNDVKHMYHKTLNWSLPMHHVKFGSKRYNFVCESHILFEGVCEFQSIYIRFQLAFVENVWQLTEYNTTY